MFNKQNIEFTLNRKTIKDPITSCWLWTGACNPYGYGKIMIRYKIYLIHRLSAMLYLNYNLKSILQINHKDNLCDHKNCWNPDHLYIGSKHQNVRDAILKGKHYKLTGKGKIM